jgi:hypothetical protein
MRFSHVLLAALFAVAGAAQARTSELIDPPPIAVPSGLTTEQVVKDVKRAFIGRGWTITTEQPGEIDSTLHLRDFTVSIKATYDASHVQLTYVDSTNLDYSEKRGKRFIHANYAGWIGFLTNDITTNFKVTAQGG